MHKIFVLIGNIASGKSTWVDTLEPEVRTDIISKDAVRYRLGDGEYLFDRRVEPHIQTIVLGTYRACVALGYDVVIDETNMTRKSREWIFKNRPDGYTVEAVIFEDRGREDHVTARLANNHGDTPRETWERVYDRNKTLYEPPCFSEGFSVIQPGV